MVRKGWECIIQTLSHLRGGITPSCCSCLRSLVLRKCQTMMRKNFVSLRDKLINQLELRWYVDCNNDISLPSLKHINQSLKFQLTKDNYYLSRLNTKTSIFTFYQNIIGWFHISSFLKAFHLSEILLHDYILSNFPRLKIIFLWMIFAYSFMLHFECQNKIKFAFKIYPRW